MPPVGVRFIFNLLSQHNRTSIYANTDEKVIGRKVAHFRHGFGGPSSDLRQ
jgi:hypothetical protein